MLRSLSQVAMMMVLTATGPARGASPPMTSVGEQLPYVKQALALGLEAEPTEALARDVDRLLARLLLDGEEAAVDRATDLHALLLLAAEVDLLERRGPSSPALRRAAVSTAYLLHLVGVAYETQPSVRAALDALPEQVVAEQRDNAELLVDSVRRMRRVGDAWLGRALAPALRDSPQDPELQTQRGLWRLREGQAADAAEAFALAFRKSQEPRHAFHLHAALLAADRGEDVAALEQRLGAASPAMKRRLARQRQQREDERATREWERHGGASDVAAGVAQLQRFGRMGREGAALLLAQQLEAQHPGDPAAEQAAGAVWLGAGRVAALEALLERAAARGPLERGLRELRVATAVRRLGAGGDSDEARARIAETLEADLSALAAEGDSRGRLIGHAARVLVPLARWRAAAIGGAEVPERGVVRQVEEAVARGIADLPASADMRLLGLAAQVGLNRAEVGAAQVRAGLDALGPADKIAVAMVLGEVEAGYAVRRRDADALAAALRGLDALAPALRAVAVDDAAWRYTRAVGAVARLVLDGQTLAEPAAREALAALPPRGVHFDPGDPVGRLWEGALAAARGTLLLVVDDREAGVRDLAGLRKAIPGEPVAKLVAAQVQLMLGDAPGAWELLGDGLGPGLRASEAFLYRKWRATAAHLLRWPEAEQAEAREQLSVWDDARMPDVIATRSPRPLFIGDFHVGLELAPGEPLRVAVRVAPVLVLVPDAPETRDEVQARAGAGASEDAR